LLTCEQKEDEKNKLLQTDEYRGTSVCLALSQSVCLSVCLCVTVAVV